MKLNRVYRYRIYPSRAQREILDQHLELSRILFNKALWWRQGAWERDKQRVTRNEQARAIVQLKKDYPEYYPVTRGIMEDVIFRVDFAYKNFFRRVKSKTEKPGHPKPHPPGSYYSMTVPRAKEFKLEHAPGDRFGFLYIRSFGLRPLAGDPIAVRMHRDLPADVAVRRVILKREPAGQWYAGFGWDTQIEPEEVDDRRVIALHPGLTHYLTTDSGEVIDIPSAFALHAQKLAKAQRRMAKKKRGSYRYMQEKVLVAKHHARIKNVRRDFLHNLSRRIVDNYDHIYVNSYDIRMMLSDGELDHLNLRVADAAWGDFLFMLSYKAEELGKVYVEVDSKDTVQECSGCGEIVHKTLKDRVHVCFDCGLKLPRGVNAARNVRKRAEESLLVEA